MIDICVHVKVDCLAPSGHLTYCLYIIFIAANLFTQWEMFNCNIYAHIVCFMWKHPQSYQVYQVYKILKHLKTWLTPANFTWLKTSRDPRCPILETPRSSLLFFSDNGIGCRLKVHVGFLRRFGENGASENRRTFFHVQSWHCWKGFLIIQKLKAKVTG